jgi:hypothetical protein
MIPRPNFDFYRVVIILWNLRVLQYFVYLRHFFDYMGVCCGGIDFAVCRGAKKSQKIKLVIYYDVYSYVYTS